MPFCLCQSFLFFEIGTAFIKLQKLYILSYGGNVSEKFDKKKAIEKLNSEYYSMIDSCRVYSNETVLRTKLKTEELPNIFSCIYDKYNEIIKQYGNDMS